SGAALARTGHDVRLLARGEPLAAIRSRGLEIREAGRSTLVPLAASDRVEDLGPADLALVAVKSYSLAEVAPGVIALLSDFCIVVVGERPGGRSERAERVAAAFRDAGAAARASAAIEV